MSDEVRTCLYIPPLCEDSAREVSPLQPHVQKKLCSALIYLCAQLTSSSAPLRSAQESQARILPGLITPAVLKSTSQEPLQRPDVHLI